MDLQKVIKLTSSQYNILASGGTVGSYIGFNPSYLYVVEESVPPYVPLSGTVSLYGSIIPQSSAAINLGRESSSFQSIYANHMSVSSIWTQGISWPGTIYITANTQIVGGGGGGNLYLNAGSYVSTTASSIYTKAYKDVSIYASSSIFIGASKNLELRADGGIAFLYGSQETKIVAGESMGGISQNATPMISLCLSGGWCPFINISANYSGYGCIDLYTGAGNAKLRGIPIMTGWQHNICGYCKQSTHVTAFTCVLYTSSNSPIDTGEKLRDALKSAGYYKVVPSSSFKYPVSDFAWSCFCPVMAATGTYYWSNYRIIGICTIVVQNQSGGMFGYLNDGASEIRCANYDASPYQVTVSDNVHFYQFNT